MTAVVNSGQELTNEPGATGTRQARSRSAAPGPGTGLSRSALGSSPVLPIPGAWVDDGNTVVRRGMVASLAAEGVPVIGESAALQPEPALERVKVLIFEADAPHRVEVLHQARRRGVQLVATVRQPTGALLHRLAEEGAAAILLMAELTPDSLVHAVRTAAQDRTTLSRSALLRLLEHAARLSPEGAGQLTTRERKVLQLLADGEETRSIALEMNYSERTVKNVVHDVLTKLNCRTRAQAVGVAMRSGLI
ncbi:MAG TPA: response regulator transcription factor [Kineosporiaceae bacterium]|nr:response regulator transcription factor [Kineosporiaceae bacterium]